MKYFALLFLTIFFSDTLFAHNSGLSKIAIIQQDGNWIEMLPDSRIETGQFFEKFLADLGLDENYHFELLDSSNDDLGYTHFRYQENFNGHPVEGGTYILHVKDGFVSHANGKLIKGILDSDQMTVSAENALAIAKNHVGSGLFCWEVPEMETLIKHIKNDPDATFLPEPELVFAHAQYSEDGEKYNLTWKYELYSADQSHKKTVFVDASSGDVLFQLEGCHHSSVEGVAETRYHGTQTIITDSISPTEYRLVDVTRGGGIETYDMNENVGDYSLAVDFIDEDNFWDNANAELDDAATDAHWGAEMFYDYFLQEHGRDSYDGNGTMMVSYVHYDEDYSNAFWNGLYSTFGDGNENPLTPVNIVAHEFAHGLTEFSAGLIYQNESGALNESFSDIFGIAVEFFAVPTELDWKIGVPDFEFRDMSNPNSYGDPDTYEGNNWYGGSQDNGGVHTNSGVQNFWFYLMSNGGSGSNDNGDAYLVDSLGIDKASAIAFRNLTVYLTESSNYMDARIGALQAAEDLYGTCSEEVLQVAKAWHAVGVGSENIAPDLQVLEVVSPLNSSCDLNSEEQISMNFRFNPSGCGLTLEAGDEIQVSYKLNVQPPIVETIVLTGTLNEGDIITHDFQTLADLSMPDQYSLDFTVSYVGDLISSNNEISDHEITNPFVISDDNVLGFENFFAKDSLYVVLGSHAEGRISSSAENTGTKGFLMNSFGASTNNTTIIANEDDNYTANPEFISKMCTCVDLSGWDEAYLNFDLRQTYSPLYLNEFGQDLYYMIAMRVTVDELQIGEQFHPQSNDSDPYLSHNFDMNDYAGSNFTLCFEGVHFVSDDDDPDGIGDKSMLDNIYFSQSGVTGSPEHLISNVEVYPNPTNGMLNIEIDASGIHELKVLDLLGNIVQDNSWLANGASYGMDLSGLAKGTYILSIRSEKDLIIRKVLLE